MIPEQFNFTSRFQESILACMVQHPDKFVFLDGVLKPVYFSTTHGYLVCKLLLEYHKQHSRFPSWPALEQMLLDEVKRIGQEENSEEYTLFLNRLEEMATNDVDYVLSKIVDFARERAVLVAVRETLDAVEKGEMGKFNVITKFEEALRVGSNVEDIGVILSGDPANSDIEAIVRKQTAHRHGVKCGWPELDKLWPGGWQPGWLITFLAPPKRYKTATVLNIAYNIAKSDIGKDVLVYPCEISQELAACRILTNMSGQTMEYMRDKPFQFIAAAQEAATRTMGGRIIMKGFSSKAAQLSEIRSHAKMIKAALNLDLGAIIIDYAETVRPSASPKDVPHYRLSAEVYTEARAIGNELGCAVIMPDRCNAETVDLPVPSMKSFQGAFEKAGIVDVAIGLCATNEEHANNDLRMFVFLNRHGKSLTHLQCEVNPETWVINVVGEAAEYQEAEDRRPLRGQGRLRMAGPALDNLLAEVPAGHAGRRVFAGET